LVEEVVAYKKLGKTEELQILKEWTGYNSYEAYEEDAGGKYGMCVFNEVEVKESQRWRDLNPRSIGTKLH